MGFSLVQTASDQSTTSIGVDGIIAYFGTNTTAGNLVIAAFSGINSTTTPVCTVTDESGNTYNLLATNNVFDGTNHIKVAIYYAIIEIPNTQTQFDFSSTDPNIPIVCVLAAEYSCDLGSIAPGPHNTSTSSATADLRVTTAALSGTTNLLFAFCGFAGSATSITGTAGWAERYNYDSGVGGGGFPAQGQDKLNVSTTSTSEWIPNTSAGAVGVMVTFGAFFYQPVGVNSSRYELPAYDRVWWQQYRHWPTPVQNIPTAPATHQTSQQLGYQLPAYLPEWQFYHKVSPIPVGHLPLPPLLRQTNQQLSYALPTYNQEWEAYIRRWPVVVEFIAPRPPTHQANQQLSYQLFDFTGQVNYEQFRHQPLPSNFSGGLLVGDFRVQNNIAGYNVYVGSGVLPDLTQPPTVFSATLPINYTLTPPVSGITTFYVIVCSQDVYGLISQNQYPTLITIDSGGDLVRSAITPPQSLTLYQQANAVVRVLATYPGARLDTDPADKWKVWIKSSTININTDPPAAVLTISSNGTLAYNQTGLLQGTLYNVVVALYRTVDGSTSQTLSGTITTASDPNEVTPIPSGFDGL